MPCPLQGHIKAAGVTPETGNQSSLCVLLALHEVNHPSGLSRAVIIYTYYI